MITFLMRSYLLYSFAYKWNDYYEFTMVAIYQNHITQIVFVCSLSLISNNKNETETETGSILPFLQCLRKGNSMNISELRGLFF